MPTIEIGKTGTSTRVISEKDTALRVGSGSLPVCATPVLSAVMEAAAVDALKDCLPEGTTSVGIAISLSHKAPTLVGRTVTASATLTAAEGRKLTFRIEARDEAGEVGSADHVRFLVEETPFMEKAAKRYL